MDTKKCCRCGQEKPCDQFAWKSQSANKRQSRCRECQKEMSDAWYAANKAKHATNVRRNQEKYVLRNQEFVLSYLKTHPCVDCGESDPVVLEFDHVRGAKLCAIAVLVCAPMSILVISREIEKCDVRCANCHRRKTAREGNHYRHSALGNLG